MPFDNETFAAGNDSANWERLIDDVGTFAHGRMALVSRIQRLERERDSLAAQLATIRAERDYLSRGVQMLFDAAKDKASITWIESNAGALIRHEEFDQWSVVTRSLTGGEHAG